MRFSPTLAVTLVTLALALSGCIAAPLAQMAVSQMMATPKPACAGCTTDTTMTAFTTISQGVTDSFHKLTGAAPENPKTAGAVPVK